jgi:GPH family glycoside/pentoside/hexuronide:cation symporter
MSSESDILHSPLSRSEPIAPRNSPTVYGLGTLGLESAFKVFAGYYMFFYVDVLGLAVTLAAIVNVLYAVWDAVNDPLFGYISDNTRTRWGRRRPWLLAGLPFYVVFLVLIYSVPEAFQQGPSLFWYALAMVFLFETASTVMNTNYEALFPELFQEFGERTRASAYNHGLGMIGELVGFSLTPIVYSKFGFVGMAVLFAIGTGMLLIISITRNCEDPSAQKHPPLGLKNAFREVLRDRPFWQFTVVATFLWFTTGVYTIAIPFYSKYTLAAGPRAPSILFGTCFVVAIGVVSLWSKLVREWGIKRTWLWAIGVMILSAAVLGLASNLAAGVLGAAVAGVGLGGVKVCREMVLANLVDRSIMRSGHRREGIYYGLNRFIGRLSKILEALALALLGVLFGYVSGENPGPHPENAFRFLTGVFPFVCLVLAWVLARRLDFGSDPELPGTQQRI